MGTNGVSPDLGLQVKQQSEIRRQIANEQDQKIFFRHLSLRIFVVYISHEALPGMAAGRDEFSQL